MIVMGIESLRRNLCKTWTKIQNVMPNKTIGCTENIPMCEQTFGGRPPTTGDHVVSSSL